MLALLWIFKTKFLFKFLRKSDVLSNASKILQLHKDSNQYICKKKCIPKARKIMQRVAVKALHMRGLSSFPYIVDPLPRSMMGDGPQTNKK